MKTMFTLILLTSIAAIFLATAGRVLGQAPPKNAKQTLYYIPHTHWEGAVFKTREEYLEMGLPHILQMLRLMKKYPDYKFTLDQVACIKPFLERYPEEAAAFKKFVKEGRLGIVGGMDIMPDVVKPGGELFVRQMQYGKRYCREQFGLDVSVAWLLDTFGHHSQMPQLLKLAGYKSFWFCRGVANDRLPSEFFWKGIDGTEIPAFWLPGFYGLFYGPPNEPDQFAKFFQARFDTLNRHANGPERVGLAGVDVSAPEEHVPPLIEQFNRRSDAPFNIRFSVPTEFAEVVARRKDTPVISADFNPIFQGTYSSRPELKQGTKELERKLLTAEKLGALAGWLGEPVDNEMTWRAWEPVLFNQTHDLASGVMTDHVYDDTAQSNGFSMRLANEMIGTRWDGVARHIDTRGDGIPIVVFNGLGWPRTDVAEVDVGFADIGTMDVDLVDAFGKATPVQLESVERYSDGGLSHAKLCFVARDIPALGYATYRVIPRRANAAPSPPTSSSPDSIENEFYRVTFNLKSGEITSLFDKSTNWEALSGPANVVSRQLDKGDLWELYRGLDGASHIAMTNKQPVPNKTTANLSTEYSGKPGNIRRGRVYSEFSISHPLDNGPFETRVRVYNGVRRLDITSVLVNNEKYVRYQALFPTSIADGRSMHEIPFGAVERPAGIEFPAQNWVDYSDGKHGVALLNFGQPGNVVSDGVLMLSLMRSHNLGAYGFGGGYEPGMSSESGFMLGKRVTFRYSVIPHAGDWRSASVYRDGHAFTDPLLARKVAVHNGSLPARWAMLEISQPNVELTAFKPGPDTSVILRVYEASGKSTPNVKIKLNARVSAAQEANLMEDSGAKLAVQDNSITIDLHPFEIKTIKFKLSAQKSRYSGE